MRQSRYSCADDGDLGRGARHCLGSRGGDGKNKVVAVVHELLRDGLAGRLVVLSIMLVNRVGDARIVERLDESLVCLVERFMLGELQDTDLELLFAACAGACSKAACGHKCCSTSEHCKCAATCDISGHADSLLIVSVPPEVQTGSLRKPCRPALAGIQESRPGAEAGRTRLMHGCAPSFPAPRRWGSPSAHEKRSGHREGRGTPP